MAIVIGVLAIITNFFYKNVKDVNVDIDPITQYTTFNSYFSLSTLGNDFSSRIALITLICYLYNRLKPKQPDLTYWTLVYQLGNKLLPENVLKGLSVICENFGYNCSEFPTFGIEDKKIPAKIKEIFANWLPF